MRFGPNTMASARAKTSAVHAQSGPGPSVPKNRILMEVPAASPQPGRNAPTNSRVRKKNTQKRDIRANPVKALSPVATAQRPISMLIQSCRKTPRAAAHIISAPNFAVIHGQRMSSPEPTAIPTMTAPGPVIFQNPASRSGMSAERSDGMSIIFIEWTVPAQVRETAVQPRA